MENSIIYFLKLSSEKPHIDDFYNLLDLETTYNLSVGDVINLKNKPYSDNLVQDYQTYLFKIIDRVFLSDDDNENNGGVLTLSVVPYFIK